VGGNKFYEIYSCDYCGVEPGEPCRQTMLDHYTPVEPHKMRQARALEEHRSESD